MNYFKRRKILCEELQRCTEDWGLGRSAMLQIYRELAFPLRVLLVTVCIVAAAHCL